MGLKRCFARNYHSPQIFIDYLRVSPTIQTEMRSNLFMTADVVK